MHVFMVNLGLVPNFDNGARNGLNHAYFRVMRRAVSILLLVVMCALSAFPGMSGHDLSRLGHLAQHYRHHIEQHQQHELSFIEFLVEHYATPQSHQDEPWEHSSLPMHPGAACTATSAAVDLPATPLIPTVSEASPQTYAHSVAVGSPIHRTSCLDQPPRF